jgi:LDH2 family malate/lactate/ureidoglycolate dehydrogenase
MPEFMIAAKEVAKVAASTFIKAALVSVAAYGVSRLPEFEDRMINVLTGDAQRKAAMQKVDKPAIPDAEKYSLRNAYFPRSYGLY